MMKFQKFDRRSGEMIDIKPTLCEFGITEAIIPLITSLATSAGIGATTAGVIGSIAGPALVSSGLGAGISALAGGNIGQGALLGGLGGALGPAFNAVGITSGGVANALGLGGSGGALTGQAAQDLESGASGASAGAGATGSLTGQAAQDLESGASDPGATTAAKTAAGISTSPGTGGAVHGLGLGNVVGLLGALMSQAQRPSTTQPAAPPGFTTPWNPNPSTVLGRTANQFTPAGGSYYTYGQQAQPQFFNNNQLTFPQPQMAKGGALRHAIRSGAYTQGSNASAHGALNQFSTGGGEGHVQGDGDGTSDSIPARLSNDEYVLTAGDVSRIGQGSTDAGVQKLDHMREQIANDAGAKKFQGKVKPPLSYLREAA